MLLPRSPVQLSHCAVDAAIAACDGLRDALPPTLPLPAAEVHLDDIEDLIKLIRSKLMRAWEVLDGEVERQECFAAANDNGITGEAA